MAAAGLVTFLVAVKVLIMIPPEDVDLSSQRHNKVCLSVLVCLFLSVFFVISLSPFPIPLVQ